ncbi:hypothetical protein MUU46_18710 [Scandinavium sp. TWS1a]|nr:hypothetical protein [Scandinavium tedordense]
MHVNAIFNRASIIGAWRGQTPFEMAVAADRQRLLNTYPWVMRYIW